MIRTRVLAGSKYLLVGTALIVWLLALQTATPAGEPDPCHSALRCHRVAEILGAGDAKKADRLYLRGCRAAPERMARALRMYELHEPNAEKLILHAIPRSYKDYFSAYVISSSDLDAGSSVKYDLPASCIESDSDTSQLGRLQRYWWKVLIPIVARHPRYTPRAIDLYEFFGYDNPPVDEAEGFPDLVRQLYRSNPAAFCLAVKQSSQGKDALLDAMTTDDLEWDLTPRQTEHILRTRKCGQFGIKHGPGGD